MAQKKVLVIGLGRFGSALAEELWETNCELIVIDRDHHAIDAFKSRSSAAFVADAAEPGVLENIGARDVDSAVVTPGEDFETTVLCVSHLAELKVKTIFARAASERQARVLEAVGATRAIRVEDEMGRRLAVQVINPVAAHLLDFTTGFRVVPWVAVPPYLGKTLAEVRLTKFGINVLGYLRGASVSKEPRPHLRFPTADYRIDSSDTLILVGEEDAVEKFLSALSR